MMAEPSLLRSDANLRNALSRYGWLLLVLIVCSVAVLPWAQSGIGSWDGHKILLSVRALLDHHRVVLSRIPGHPTTDIYLFGAAGWLIEHGFHGRFGDTALFFFAWAAGLIAGGLFHGWLRRSGVASLPAAVATVCLLFSPQFLCQTLDGEEFVIGIDFLLAAIVVLPRTGVWQGWRMAMSAALMALASGARPELLAAAAVIYPIWFWRMGSRRWQQYAVFLVVLSASLLLVWLPVLVTNGPHSFEYQRMSLSQIVLVWGYKLLFICFGFPTSLVLFGVATVAAVRAVRQDAGLRGLNADGLVAMVLAIIYVLLFAIMPHKPAYVLVALPCVLWWVARQNVAVLLIVAGLTILNLFVSVDIFRGRELAAPHLAPGWYRNAVAEKPGAKVGYLRRLTSVPTRGKTAVIGDLWSWSYDYYLDRGLLQAERTRIAGRIMAFAVPGRPDCFFVPREYGESPVLVRRLHDEGYAIVMDGLLWRTLYARYDVASSSPADGAVDGVPVRLAAVARE